MRFAHEHAAHRHGAVGHALGEGDHVGHDAERLGGERRAEPAEAGDDLVEDEQDAVLVADLRAAARDSPWAAAGTPVEPAHRLDDHRGDGRGIVQRDDALELVGELAPCSGSPRV